MAIENNIQFITIEEFKKSTFYNQMLTPEDMINDNDITFAIDMAQSNIDYLSGFRISNKWPKSDEEQQPWQNSIKLAMGHYVRHILIKGVDYFRGQSSISIAGISQGISNPDDPYFIPPEVFNYLRKENLYTSLKGYDIKGIESKRYSSPFSNFSSNKGDNSILNRYLQIVNILDSSTIEIERINNNNIIGEQVKFNLSNKLEKKLELILEKQEKIKNDLKSLKNDLVNLKIIVDAKKDILISGNGIEIKNKKINVLTGKKAYVANQILETNIYDWPKIVENQPEMPITTYIYNLGQSIQAIQKFLQNVFYQGEYKWTKTDVTLPKPWKKVNIENGFTLVQGAEEQVTKGSVNDHKHGYGSGSSVPTLQQPTTWKGATKYFPSKGESGNVDKVITYIGNNTPFGNYTTGSVTGPNIENNLPAGINAQLWVFDPENKY